MSCPENGVPEIDVLISLLVPIFSGFFWGYSTKLELGTCKGGINSEDTGELLLFQNKRIFQITILSRKFTVLGGKFKFPAHDSDFEYLF